MNDYQQKLLELAELEASADNEYPHRAFKPNAKQAEFIENFCREGAYIVNYCGGNGSGKTTVPTVMLAAMIWGSMGNPVFARPFIENYPHPKRVRIVTESTAAMPTGPLATEIKKWWPAGRYEALKLGKNYTSQYKATGKNGEEWLIDVMTLSQEVPEFESGTFGMVWFDEPPSKEIFDACVGRTRSGGMLPITMTPLYSGAWIKDELIDKEAFPRVQTTFSSLEDNCSTHGVGGVLDHTHIEKLIATWDPEMVEARVSGKFMHLSGLIFNTFERAVHVTKEPLVPPANVPIYTVCDPAAGRPFFIIFAWADAAGRVFIYDEYPNGIFENMKNPKFTVKDYADVVRQKEGGRRVEQRIIDRHYANARNFSTGKSLRQEFQDDYDMDWVDSYRGGEEVETGILSVKKYLAYDKTRPMDSVNSPRLLISPTCINTIRHMERWARDPKTGRPQEAYKDGADVVRYLCEAEPKWTPSAFAGYEGRPILYGRQG